MGNTIANFSCGKVFESCSVKSEWCYAQVTKSYFHRATGNARILHNFQQGGLLKMLKFDLSPLGFKKKLSVAHCVM